MRTARQVKGSALNQARRRYGELASTRQALAPDDARLVTRLFTLERLLDLHFRQSSLVPLTTFPTETDEKPTQ